MPYEIKANPKKIDVLGVKCDVIVNDAKNEAANAMASGKGLDKTQRNCVRETFLAGNYFDSMAIAVALANAKDMKVSQVEEEKTKFIEEMIKMTNACNKCVLKKEKKEEKTEEGGGEN